MVTLAVYKADLFHRSDEFSLFLLVKYPELSEVPSGSFSDLGL